jgi:hypothetical protein
MMWILQHKSWLAALVFLSCFVFYLFFWSGVHYSIDGVVMFEYAKSILFQHSFSMIPPVRWNGVDILVSKWAIGQTLVYFPSLWILSQTIFRNNPSYTQVPYNPNLDSNPALLVNTSYLSVSLTNALITGLTASVLFLLLTDLGFTRRKAVAAALIFGLASPAADYAKFDFAQPLAAFFLLVTFWFLFKATGNLKRIFLLLSGFALGAAVLARTELLVYQVPLMLVAAWLGISSGDTWYSMTRRKVLDFCVFCLPVLLIAGANQYLNDLRFGGWFAVGYNVQRMAKIDFYPILGNSLSPGRGVFFFFPFALFSFFCVRQLKRSKQLWIVFISAFGSILFYSFFNDGWAAGMSWGPRLLVPYLPFFTILGLLGYEQVRIWSRLFANISFIILTALGGIFTLQGLLFNFLDFYSHLNLTAQMVNDGQYNFWFGYSPVLTGWAGLFSPLNYDIFWIRHPYAGGGVSQLIFLFIGVIE